MRRGIRRLIEEFDSAEVVGEAGTVATALSLFAEHRPAAVVLDLYLPDGNSFGVITEIKRSHPSCVVMVLTNFATPEGRAHCLELGVDYFFDKSMEFERVPEVLAGLRTARGGSGT